MKGTLHKTDKGYSVITPEGKIISVEEYMKTEDYDKRLRKVIDDYITPEKESELLELFQPKQQEVTPEQMIAKYFPNGAVNLKLKGGGDGKKQYEYEKKIMKEMLLEYAASLKL